ncbi:MAG: hypothetical protein ETSY1_38475 [Candidatus Entotheonella factor]|uniref:Uncharacterized protein n=1 Tax=Entotheonella factor TaxID=1429438 RepID=W4L8C2_ENTF1|nr:MAG: hypothetical protein ETSY1_38475 [Candidatus Entotheonella factor]
MADLEILRHLAMLVGGLALIVFGFWGSNKFRWPFDGIAAFAAPIGLLLSIVGVILLIIPTFFTKP